MLVRLGPVFRIGSLYLPNSEEKKKWHGYTDKQRLDVLLSGKYLWFSLELGILAFACTYFSILRLFTYGILVENTCQFI